ncbi:sugar phosphate isomerase/epimerase family protein [Deminuibacter soli]|uniref:Sugar phosphate isomerase/epimerase n=1 Tax=Deminuibacter soli TaxID=2291815 RepID=A0A3E1NHS2_9BACT|nr:sugar phosphate isomerase/epimerase [Deminuibacter soli]RFM27489.1 sugar phosphate isomerase/epimerase [Deminuibacter soli]
MSSRRNFLQITTLGIAGSAALPLAGWAAQPQVNATAGENPLPVGIAGFTFAKFDLDASIAMMKRLDLHYLSVKDFHLPLNSDAAKIAAVRAKLDAAGIQPYTVGVIYMKTKQAVDDTFAYAKRVGVPLIIGVPDYDLIDYTEQQVKAYDIKIAIHNHGPEDKLYPGPKDVYDRIKNRDPRMGLCLDIGHAERAGTHLTQAIHDYRDRLFDLHIKDVTAAEKDGKAIEIGRGVIDFAAVIKALEKINYKGVCSIEFEKDMTDPLPGIAESVGYFKGVMKG